MKSLFAAFLATGLVYGQGLGGMPYNKDARDTIEQEKTTPNKRSVEATPSTPTDSDMAESQHGWAPLGYNGPLAMPELRNDGTLAETQEVNKARAAHLAALEYARSSNPDMDDGEYDPRKYGDDHYGVMSHNEDILNNALFYDSIAKGHHGLDEVVGPSSTDKADEDAAIAAWKAKNAATASAAPPSSYGAPAAPSSAANTGGYSHGAPESWNVPVTAGGYSYEAESKAAALAMLKANAAAAVVASYGPPNKPYFGPLAMLQVLPTGFLADTQEVAAARRIHLSALAEAEAAALLWRTKNAQQQQPWG